MSIIITKHTETKIPLNTCLVNYFVCTSYLHST